MKYSAQEIDRETTLQTSQKQKTIRIPFTLTYHPQNFAVKSVILKNLKCSAMIPKLNTNFLYHHLFHSNAAKNKNIGNSLVRSAFKSGNQPATFKCKCTRCNLNLSLYSVSNIVKISGPNRSAKITDHFTCFSANVIYCITCTLYKKI